MNPRFTFITLYDKNYSRSGVLLSYMENKQMLSGFIKLNSWKSIASFAINVLQANKNTDYFVIMVPSQSLTLIVRLLTSKKIILDAGWPLSDRTKTSIWLMTKLWITDLIAMHSANLVLLESELQKKQTAKRFKVSEKKLAASHTGVEEVVFTFSDVQKQPTVNTFQVCYRGQYNFEAGIEVLAQTSLLCDDPEISFLVVSRNIPDDVNFGENTVVKNKPFANKRNMAEVISKCDLMLGQLSNHPRLNVTIPHKTYEAAIMGKPYLSARATGIKEFLVEGAEAEYFDAGDPVDLLRKIKKLKADKDYRKSLGENILVKFKATASEEAIGDNFLKLLDRN
jgi:hypothetical protein